MIAIRNSEDTVHTVACTPCTVYMYMYSVHVHDTIGKPTCMCTCIEGKFLVGCMRFLETQPAGVHTITHVVAVNPLVSSTLPPSKNTGCGTWHLTQGQVLSNMVKYTLVLSLYILPPPPPALFIPGCQAMVYIRVQQFYTKLTTKQEKHTIQI